MPGIECIDLTLVDDIPTVLDVFVALENNFVIGKAWMANEFLIANTRSERAIERKAQLAKYIEITLEPHPALKERAANAIGLIRTADTIPYANIVIESA